METEPGAGVSSRADPGAGVPSRAERKALDRAKIMHRETERNVLQTVRRPAERSGCRPGWLQESPGAALLTPLSVGLRGWFTGSSPPTRWYPDRSRSL